MTFPATNALVLGLLLIVQSQQTGTIEGIVVKLGTSEPLAGARVAMTKPGAPAGASPAYATTTNAEGKFSITGIQPASYRLFANRPDGFMTAEYGQTRSHVRGVPITVGIGQTLRSANMMAEC
ncbi:MAG: carboxypeptidase regulatory-like domain-containing protein [Acidobacteria bacterium]|nr:carboxypeptidase regulatory-like domain-containing protein [Acidobacteriota bacterium]